MSRKIHLISVLCIMLMMILFQLNMVAAQDNWIYMIGSAKIDVEVDSAIQLLPTSAEYAVESVFANLTFVPQETWRQDVFDFNYGDGGLAGDDEIKRVIYEWHNPDSKNLEYGFDAGIDIISEFRNIKKKVDFPSTDIPENVKDYLGCTEKIDCDSPSIITRASTLASGKTDLFDVAFTFATFVNENINYNLYYSHTVESASDILSHKQGVCSEYATLFIALCRAVRIPARYVSGEAYSNMDNSRGFGEHAWAEVYFLGTGWVPFDPTYGEYGMVDVTHISLKKSIDSNEASIKFSWQGRNVDLKTGDLDIKAKIVENISMIEPFISLDAKLLRPKIAIGSYGALKVKAKNLLNKYVSTTLYVSQTQNMIYDNSTSIPIFLGPGETKVYFWVFHVSDELDEGYKYDFPITVYTKQMHNTSTQFETRTGNVYYTYDDVLNLIKQQKDTEQAQFSGEFLFNCTSNRKEYVLGETAKIECVLNNEGNTMIEGLTVCVMDSGSCKKTDLGIMQKSTMEFDYKFNTLGTQEILIIAKNREISKAYPVSFNVVNGSEIKIVNVSAPECVDYDDDFQISFLLERKSDGLPLNVKFFLIHQNFMKEWSTESMMYNSIPINEKLKGELLSFDENDFLIKVVYEDVKGKKYCKDHLFKIRLDESTFIQKVLIWVSDLLSTEKYSPDKERC